jgi:hypothetical protein
MFPFPKRQSRVIFAEMNLGLENEGAEHRNILFSFFSLSVSFTMVIETVKKGIIINISQHPKFRFKYSDAQYLKNYSTYHISTNSANVSKAILM